MKHPPVCVSGRRASAHLTAVEADGGFSPQVIPISITHKGKWTPKKKRFCPSEKQDCKDCPEIRALVELPIGKLWCVVMGGKA